MLRLGLLLLVIPSVLLMVGYMYEQSLVSGCLDAGGSFNYTENACDQQNTHPFVPYLARHPLWVNGGMLLTVLGTLLCIVGLYKRS